MQQGLAIKMRPGGIIGDTAIKVACVQTLPGAEFYVAAKLEDACRKLDFSPHLILKGFGSFDIVLLYATPNFSSPHLSMAGIIPGILKSNLFLCFSYSDERGASDKMFEQLASSTFIGFSLLKVNPKIQVNSPEAEILIARLVREKSKKLHFLGTLGWNELILMITNEDIAQLFSDLYSFTLTTSGSQEKAFKKTFSFLGINYETMRTGAEFTFNSETVRGKLAENESINRPISKELEVSIGISFEPQYSDEVRTFWKNKNFAHYDVMGKDDLIVSPKGKLNWSLLIASLLGFRYQFRNRIFSTHTMINRVTRPSIIGSLLDVARKLYGNFFYSANHQDNLDLENETLEIPAAICSPERPILYLELVEMFGRDLAAILATHLYALNSLCSNPITGSAFQDMRKYPNYIMETGRLLLDLGEDTHAFGASSVEALRHGAELRSYGTYGTVEEVAGRFSKFRGGAQRATLALEYLPWHIFKRLGGTWEGFIIAHHPKFYHTNDVISVPPEALWEPNSWWALYHEVGHIIVETGGEWVGKKVPQVSHFLVQKDHHEFWLKLLSELAAEIVGFQLGFFGDYDLFLNLLWKHLSKIEPLQANNVPREVYILRTFYVYIFYNHFILGEIEHKQVLDDDFIYDKMKDHISRIEVILGHDITNKRIIAAKNTDLFRDLYEVSKHIFSKMKERPLALDVSAKDSENTNAVWTSINSGESWPEEVEAPEAILYRIFQRQDFPFQCSIAAILTFWNQAITKMGMSNELCSS
ncbi:MAG: hypothetical protein ABSC04_09770 [Syntrophobacteraceae bacterium]